MTYCRGPSFTPWLLLTADQWMPATTDRHRITVAWNVRFDNTCQPLSAPFTWPALFWGCSGLILKDFRPSVTHGNTNVLIGVDTHKHVMPHASLKEQNQLWKNSFLKFGFLSLRPLSVSFLFRTSGKEYHSQAGSTTAHDTLLDLGRTSQKQKPFFWGLPKLPLPSS